MCGDRLTSTPVVTAGLPTAPPTQPLVIARPAPRSSWPAAIGIISIVFGAFGVLQSLWGVLSPLLWRLLVSLAPQEQGMPFMQMTQKWQTWTVISSLVAMVLAVLLLAVGVGLIKRRAWAISAGRAWAMLKIPWVVVGALFGCMIARESFDAIEQQDPAAMSAMPGVFSDLMVILSLAFGVVWGCAFPVFLLIWFSRRRVKDEVVHWA